MDHSVRTTSFQVESRGWLWGTHGTEPGANPSITLDLALFDGETHYPNGYVPSGIVLGKTDGDLYGPYDPAATDGRQTAAGLLFSAETVHPGQTRGTNALFVHGFVDPARLPVQSGSGSLNADARTALPLIHWA